VVFSGNENHKEKNINQIYFLIFQCFSLPVAEVCLFSDSHMSQPPLVPWRSYVGAAILGGGIGYTVAHLFKVL